MSLTRLLLQILLATKGGGARDWELSTVVRVAYGLGDTTQEPRSTTATTNDTNSTTAFSLDYLAHLRHLDLEWTAAGDHFTRPNIKIQGDLDMYILGDEYGKLIDFDQFLDAWMDNYLSRDIRIWCLWTILRREVTWAIAGPILEQLRSLVIPVSDIRRYHGSIDRFRNLEEVRFSLDEPLDYGEEYSMDLTAEFVKTTQQRKAESLAAIVMFVKDHVRLFPARLQFVTCTNGALYNFEPQECPKETLVEISQLLPTLPRPLYLDEHNWSRFIVAPLRIDLGAVERVVFPEDTHTWWYRTVCENREFLRRCRSLRKLKMVTLGPGTFRWAVQEKQDMDRFDNRAAPDVASTTLLSSSTNEHLPQKKDDKQRVGHGLMPIRSITISEDSLPFADEINDIAIGFSQTLERLSIQASTQTEPFPQLGRVIPVGQGWVNLPVLRKLYLDTANASLVLDRQIWVRCPGLVRLEVVDPTIRYRCQDIIPCLPGHHANLDILSLQGSSALTFDPATLDSTPKLTSLYIFTGDMDAPRVFIPPVQELERSYGMQGEYDQEQDEEGVGEISFQTGSDGTTNIIVRPRWTWNWDLPVLTCAMFNSEFAYRFQFRMLQGCPHLETLQLNMTSMDGPHAHTRVLSDADLFIPPFSSLSSSSTSSSHSISGNNIQQGERIASPSLRFLELSGHWVIDDMLLGEFLAGTFPNLTTFKKKTFGGISLVGLLKVMREFSLDEGCDDAGGIGGVGGEGGDIGKGKNGERAGGGRLTLSNLQMVRIFTPFNLGDVELTNELGVYPYVSYKGQERLNARVCLKPMILFGGELFGARDYYYNERLCVVLRDPIR